MPSEKIMQGKRGQVTVFILLGILLLFIVGLLVYLLFAKTETLYPVVEENEMPLQTFVEQCLADVTVPGIYLLASQGGFIALPDKHLAGMFGKTAYGYHLGEQQLISRKGMEEQLAGYITVALGNCIGNFSNFPEGVTVLSDPTAHTDITLDRVTVVLDYRLRIADTTISRFTKEIMLPLGALHAVALQSIEQLLADDGWIDLTALADSSYPVTVIPHDKDTLLYSSTANDLIFLFAARIALNEDPVLLLEDAYSLKENEPFFLDIPYTSDDDVVFSDDSPLFDITPAGVIDVTPEIPGTFEVTITAADTTGNSASKNVRFTVYE